MKDLCLLSTLRSIGVVWQVYIFILEGIKTLSPHLIISRSHLQTSLFFQTSYLFPQSPSDLFILPNLLSLPTVTFRPLSFLRDSHQSSLLKWPHSCLICMLILQSLGQLDLFILPLINWVELLFSTQFWLKNEIFTPLVRFEVYRGCLTSLYFHTWRD